jgi:hypothetical protein
VPAIAGQPDFEGDNLNYDSKKGFTKQNSQPCRDQCQSKTVCRVSGGSRDTFGRIFASSAG